MKIGLKTGENTRSSKARAALAGLLLLIFSHPMPTSAREPASKTVYLAPFAEFNCTPDPAIKNKILEETARALRARGFAVKYARGASLESNLQEIAAERPLFLIQGFYRTQKSGGLEIFGQIYNPLTGYVIDAVNVTPHAAGLEGIKLPEEELRVNADEAIRKFANKIVLRARANPKRNERKNNIDEFIVNSPIGKFFPFPIKKDDLRRESAEVFKVLGETEVVSASRNRQKLSEAPSNIVVITREMIRRRGYMTLTEVLQDVPFFDFTTFQPAGEYPTHFILRGVTDVGQTKVLIMEDGIVQNDISNGWARFMGYNVTLVDVERIEVVLGPGSALYGANAYAGLINIITRQGADLYDANKKAGLYFEGEGLYSRGMTKVASGPMSQTRYAGLSRKTRVHQTFSAEGLGAYKFDNGLILQLAARRFKSDGDGGVDRPDPGNYFHNNHEPEKVTTTEYGTINNDRLPDGSTKRIPDGFNTGIDDLFLRGRLFKDGVSFGFNYWDQKEGLGSEVPGYEYFANSDGIPYMIHHAGYSVFAGYETEFSRKLANKTRLYYNSSMILPRTGFVYTYNYQSVDNPVVKGAAAPPVVDKMKGYHGQGFLTGLEEQLNYKLSNSNEMTLGFQLERKIRQYYGISLGPRQDDRSTVVRYTYATEKLTQKEVYYSTNGAVFLQDEQKLPGRHALTAGVRYDVFSELAAEDVLRFRDKKIAEGTLNPRLGLVGNPLGAWRYKLLYGEAFKAPTVFELFDEWRGNPDLKPQKIKTYEYELSYQIKKYGSVKGGYFFSELTNVIEVRKNDGSVPLGPNGEYETFYQNVEATHIYGFSVGGDFNFGKNFDIYFNYNFTADRDRETPFDVQSDQKGRITSVDPVTDGHEIDNIAQRKGNIGVNWLLWERLNVNVRLNWTGRRKAPAVNKYFNPDFCDFFSAACGKPEPAYVYETEGRPDGYLSGYTLVNLVLTWKSLFGIRDMDVQMIVRNLFDKEYVGMGRQAGSAIRPALDSQPRVQNPPGFIPPYHPQPGREVFFKLTYRY